MQRSDFSFELPAELIAQAPLATRSASRLLALDGATGAVRDLRFLDLPGLLEPGDLLVFNDTRVIAARLHGTKPTGGAVEILLERPAGGHRALVQAQASKAIRPELIVTTAGGPVRFVERQDDLWLVELPEAPFDFFERWGEVPLPPYIERSPETSDRERYQTVFARVPGAVAAPTASLHFDDVVLGALDARGVERAFVTLHVGAGTFQPVRVDDPARHRMHAEFIDVPATTCAAIAAARARGRRVVAVGTTVARALESAAQFSRSGGLEPYAGDTQIFIYPGHRWRVVDAMVTNFHLPESTLVMMVSSFSGRERVLAAYAHAVRERYRFFSYGDAMFLTRASEAAA